MKRFVLFIVVLCLVSVGVRSQDIPQHISYTQIYDFIDELAIDRIISVNSVCKPYSRKYIAQKLEEAAGKDSVLTNRQRADLKFFMNEYSLELDTIYKGIVSWTDKKKFALSLLQPSFHYIDKNFKCRINPIIGMELRGNRHGLYTKRWWGAEIQATIVDHISVWASYRGNTYTGGWLDEEFYQSIGQTTQYGSRLAGPTYLNKELGASYRSMTYGADYSELRAGIKAYTWWGSIGIMKDNINWGDGYSCSNIIAGRVPSFPMITLNLTPCKWFELNYIHGWLESGLVDSTDYYNHGNNIKYRAANKFIAANMLSFIPIKGLNLSLGNATIYGTRTVNPAYFIPIALYRAFEYSSMVLTGNEDNNSMVFINIGSRNIKHLYLYFSMTLDDFSFKRMNPKYPARNPMSHKFGLQVSNWPLKNLSVIGEYTWSNIGVYSHATKIMAWTTGLYPMGHYMGANSQELYVALKYKPIRSLMLDLSYTHATKYDDRRNIYLKPYQDKTWCNDEIKLHATYEVVHNAYAFIDLGWNNARAFELTSESSSSYEVRLDKQGYLNRYTPGFYQGSNFTASCGFSFYF